ncbi:hypothetical protein Tco_0987969 [Tanacetum coccineum]|uniref:Uncharacterized protein n=1 Tax=Tanacetum coccineum TaxID=301880 RepID=A0ABQ5EPQ3_9ASTR
MEAALQAPPSPELRACPEGAGKPHTTDYPADGRDDEDDEMDIEEDKEDDMDIDADEEDEDDEMDVEVDEEAEEEHPAPAYPVVVGLPATWPRPAEKC